MRGNIIEKIESELQIVIPEDYKTFLNKGSFMIGGKSIKYGENCDNVCYEDKSNEDEDVLDFVAIQIFYGDIDSESSTCDLYKNNLIDFGKTRIPEDFITIGCDQVDDQICLGVKGEYSGKVYLWEMEQEADYGQPFPYYGNMTLITNSFQEFLDGLFIDE
ncbi:SMI1/KNR4 family protein [Flavobacterium oreochromis]|uniref:SMI1/KNR4 family protein n=1 Tax=Flavobacterium oreochromis TaxID=2906078 RepID=UPI000CDA8D15|nr:SMI1/KNR4 family protein [Flavobacterium oreochromis]POR15224.1 hypothetical protein BWK58_15360 [Flavobacterium columnare]QYS85539.1 SMI1/KNR4 family protein [Flavobacterium oreochromis]